MAGKHYSLRLKITAVIAGMIGLVAILLSLVFPARMRAVALAGAKRQAVGIAAVVANGARVPYNLADLQGPDDLIKVLTMLEDAPGALYGLVRRDDGETLASWNPNAVAIPVLDLPAEKNVFVQGDDDVLHVTTRLLTKSGGTGLLQIGFSLKQVNADGQRDRWIIFLLMASTFLIASLVLSLLVERLVVGPIRRLSQATTQVVNSGDLTRRIMVRSNDEVGALSRSIEQMLDSQRSILRTLRRLSQALVGVIQQITQSGTAVSKGAGTIQARVEAAAGSIQIMLQTIHEAQGSVEVLQQSAEHGSTTIREIATINQQAAQNSQSMAALVTQTTEAVNRMAFSIKEIAQSIDSVNAAVSDTSSSMTQLEASVIRVENSAVQSSAISAQVAADADTGALLLTKTLQGIEDIQSAFAAAAGTIDQLVHRVLDVSNILHVIEEITEQTNLLALNAAIISAQAGEHGRGFSVVADEIRALADRTKSSTHEITQLMHTIQGDSKKAIGAMNQGKQAVADGVELGREAAQFLKGIQSSSREATARVEEITQATVEQARGNSSIASAVARIAGTMNQINRVTKEQALGSEQIIQGTDKMTQVNQQVFRSSQEQGTGSEKVIESIEKISEMVDGVQRGQRQQSKGATTVLEAVKAIEEVSQVQTNSAQYLETVIQTLREYSSELERSLARFKTD